MQRIIFVVIPIFLLLSWSVNADLVIKQTESHSESAPRRIQELRQRLEELGLRTV